MGKKKTAKKTSKKDIQEETKEMPPVEEKPDEPQDIQEDITEEEALKIKLAKLEQEKSELEQENFRLKSSSKVGKSTEQTFELKHIKCKLRSICFPSL